MNNILNAVIHKLNILRENRKLRIILISVFALLLIFSVTLAWYINNLRLWGMQFSTGNIDFNAYVYDVNGVLKVGPVGPDDVFDNETEYINASIPLEENPLISVEDGEIGTKATAYIAVESTGSIGILYRIAFDVTGRNNDNTYLGGYKYNISKVTDKVSFNGGENLDVSGCDDLKAEDIKDDIVTIDRNSINHKIAEKNGYEVYRIDITLAQGNIEYVDGGMNVYFNIFATQYDGDLDDRAERGYTYYCSTREDLDRARVEAYPGDIIKLSSDIVYYGDLVFNKPVSLETNNYTLTVNGNLMYDYVLSNSLRLDVGGLGKIVVQCTKDGAGGNLQIKAPIGDVTLIGANSANGDIVVEKNVVIDATNAYGSAGASFNEIRIVDQKNSRKTIQVESNTRVTVSFDTTISYIQAVLKANNIEIINNGVIEEINLSQMATLGQTNSPQIYILNNNDIQKPILLPSWSVKFQENTDGTCTGNTRIIQSFSGALTLVSGNCNFNNDDVEVERKDSMVEQLVEGDDSRLKIYYQDVDGKPTTIQSILEEYLENVATSDLVINEIVQLEIVSVGTKVVTNDDITFMNSTQMRSLKQLDLKRATVYGDGTYHKLPDKAFEGVSKYESLVLPQNLTEIGSEAFSASAIHNIITIPSGVEKFGADWFKDGYYVRFASSVPTTKAVAGLTNVKAIFVDEAYISSYKSVYSDYSTKIYPTSVLDENKEHFVRNLMGDEWEITYYISGGNAIIGENITIDGTKLNITSIYDNAYRHNYTGTVVKFADSVKVLGSGNFADNKNIEKVELNRLESLGIGVFSGAERLADVVFGDDLETISDKAFYGCVSLTRDIVLPDAVKTIGKSVFQKSTITSVKTGGATMVDSSAFADCPRLVWAELPNVRTVGTEGQDNKLFSGCESLVSVRIPSLVRADGKKMFDYCVSLREIYMGSDDDGVTLGSILQTDVFNGCNMAKLKMFVPEKLVAFYREKCPGGIGASMIYPEGEKLGEVLVKGYNIGEFIVSDNGDDTYTLSTANLDYTDRLVIPETFNGKPVTRIYSGAFKNQTLTNVTITLGTCLEQIDDNAFSQIKGLRKVEFETATSLRVIGASAFSGCDNMVQDVIFPDTMESVGASAFNKTGILSLNTGGMVSVGNSAFNNCTSLVYVIMPEVTTIGSGTANYVFNGCTSLVSVDMPKVHKVSGEGLFQNCKSLLEIYMGHEDSDVTLGTKVFTSGYTKQVKLFVPEELLTIYKNKGVITKEQIYPRGEKMGEKSVNGYRVGDYVVLEREDSYVLVTSHLNFRGDVTIPGEYRGKPITEIYDYAFYNQTFTNANVFVDGNITKIGELAFFKATGLRTIVMDGVVTVGTSAFASSGIVVLNGPKIKNLGGYAFSSCANLEAVTLPQVEKITNSHVFYNSTNLKYVYFEKITQIQFRTFLGVTKLEKIILNRLITSSKEIPSTGSTADMVLEANAPCKIYVPYRSLAIYGDTWYGKPVVSYDIVATYNEDTYILVDDDGRYVLSDYFTEDARSELVIPDVFTVADVGDVSIYSIAPDAFSSVYTVLRSLTLPASVSYLSSDVLRECTVLENIYVDADNQNFASVDGILYSKDERILLKYPVGRIGTFDMTGSIYNSTVAIASSAFLNATDLTGIVFPASLGVIDSNAFVKCTALKTVTFTGNTPPVLMGSGIFDTTVSGFEMIIPIGDEAVISAYLNGYNFAEYEPYMVLN